jgi:hypothetical protein
MAIGIGGGDCGDGGAASSVTQMRQSTEEKVVGSRGEKTSLKKQVRSQCRYCGFCAYSSRLEWLQEAESLADRVTFQNGFSVR